MDKPTRVSFASQWLSSSFTHSDTLHCHRPKAVEPNDYGLKPHVVSQISTFLFLVDLSGILSQRQTCN